MSDLLITLDLPINRALRMSLRQRRNEKKLMVKRLQIRSVIKKTHRTVHWCGMGVNTEVL